MKMPTTHPAGYDDLPLPSGTSQVDDPRISTKRKQTLLSILDALNELTKDDAHKSPGAGPMANFEDDRDVPTVDEHLQQVGAEAFNRFQKRINNLDKELRNFANAARQLGSSVGILSSAFHLRERLAQILFLFRENAADLFPRKIASAPRESPMTPAPGHGKMRIKRNFRKVPHAARPLVKDDVDAESMPEQLDQLADVLNTFLDCLNEFPEFTDEAVNASILSFEGDLKYWSSCLAVYKGQFKYPAVQRYLHDLTTEMVEHIETITSTISMFIEVGVPTIRFAQKHTATNLLNLSTVATFFSAVTATTLQFSYNLDHSQASDAVNCFWFASLVFSIAAAVNSLLGLTWKQAMYRSPGHRVPWWVLIWIKRSPLVFLVIAVACFSIGLVCFAFASGQARITYIITTVITTFTCFGLAAVSAWFATERWIFSRHSGKKWLGDVLAEARDHFYFIPGAESVVSGWKRFVKKPLGQAHTSLKRVSTRTLSLMSTNGSADHGMNGSSNLSGLPMHMASPPTTARRYSDQQSPLFINTVPSPIPEVAPTSDGATTPPPEVQARGRFATAVRNIMRLQSASAMVSGAFSPLTPRRQATMSSSGSGGPFFAVGDAPRNTPDMAMAPRDSRAATLIRKLKSLETTQDLAAHSALVRHLQFSPDGKFLATSSWDRTSTIFKVGDPLIQHRILAHPQGFVGQVAWSPNGKLLLCKLNRGIKVWTDDGVCKKTIDRGRAVESITWFPDGEAFCSVEGSNVTKMDLNGKILAVYNFERMKLHDVAVTQDAQRLLGVGPLLISPTGLHPSKSRVEKRVVVYNMERKMIENQTPVLNDVRDITLARNGMAALVSYENKAPPQLWNIELLKDRENHALQTARLTLRHTYMPKVLVDFAGPSYFGGKNDQLVLCAGKAGDIHIWDRESASLLHHVRAQAMGGDLTCIAWNHAADDPFMFATGSHDGALRVWTTPSAEMPSQLATFSASPIHTPRPRSPALSAVDITDSPVTTRDFESSQVDFELQLTSAFSTEGSLIRDRRSVAFVPPEPDGEVGTGHSEPNLGYTDQDAGS